MAHTSSDPLVLTEARYVPAGIEWDAVKIARFHALAALERHARRPCTVRTRL